MLYSPRVRWLVVLSLLAACDLKPAPKKALPRPADQGSGQTAASPPVDAGVPLPPAIDDAGTKDVSAVCTEAAVQIFKVMLGAEADPALKANIEHERTQIIRRAAEACTRDDWSDSVQKCFLKASSRADLQECGKQLAQQPAAPAKP